MKTYLGLGFSIRKKRKTQVTTYGCKYICLYIHFILIHNWKECVQNKRDGHMYVDKGYNLKNIFILSFQQNNNKSVPRYH